MFSHKAPARFSYLFRSMPRDQIRKLKTTVWATGIEPAPSIWQKWICCQLQHANIAVEVLSDGNYRTSESLASVGNALLWKCNNKGTRPLGRIPLPAKLMVKKVCQKFKLLGVEVGGSC